MELTINIKEKENISTFLNIIRQMDYVEIIDIKEDSPDLLLEHKFILDERLSKAEEGKTAYKNWDLLVKKYENKTI